MVAEIVRNYRELLSAMTRVESLCLTATDPEMLFQELLNTALGLTGSEKGFLAEVREPSDGHPVVEICSLVGEWVVEARPPRQNEEQGLGFVHDVCSGVIRTGRPLVENAGASTRPTSGSDSGSRAVDRLLVLPLGTQDRMIGAIGLADRNRPYDDELVDFLGPFMATCANILTAHREQRQRDQIEAALHDSEVRIQAIVTASADSIVTFDEKGLIKSFNPAAKTKFGYDLAEVIGNDLSLLFPASQTAPSDCAVAEFIRTGKRGLVGVERELVAQSRDGSQFPVALALSEVSTSQGRLFTAIIRDITEQKAAKQKIETLYRDARAKERQMVLVLNKLGFGVVIVDESGRVTFVNRTAVELLVDWKPSLEEAHWNEVLKLTDAGRETLEEMLLLPEEDRQKVEVQFDGGRLPKSWLEIEVLDDPRETGRKVFILSDASEVHDLRRLLDDEVTFHDLVGKSDSMQTVFQQIRDISKVDWTVLIQGETGTGKELVSRAIHHESHRKNGPFIAVNCAGLTDSLLASQLFGHKKGAFTGAVQDAKGVFEMADGGTLLLDEIGDVSMNVQTSLLRVLENMEITRVGEALPRKVDVRVLVATNRDLEADVDAGTFRADLFYRLRVARLSLPPLCERREDIPLLAETFLQRSRAATGKVVDEISVEALRKILDHDWPGNVRELKSAVDFAALHCRGPVIEADDLPPEINAPFAPKSLPGVDSGFESEDDRIRAAIEAAGGNRTRAARELGMSRATLYRRISEWSKCGAEERDLATAGSSRANSPETP